MQSFQHGRALISMLLLFEKKEEEENRKKKETPAITHKNKPGLCFQIASSRFWKSNPY